MTPEGEPKQVEPQASFGGAADHRGVIVQVGRGNAYVSQLGAKSLAVIAATLVISLVVALVVIFWHRPGTASARLPGHSGAVATGSGGVATQPGNPVSGSLQARADWCCQIATAQGWYAGYYWHGSVTSLKAAMKSNSLQSISGIVPAGSAVIEVPIQTDSTEIIYVHAPQAVVLSRTADPRQGQIAVIPPISQGAGEPALAVTDIDATTPVTVPYSPAAQRGSSSSGGAFYYVTQGNPLLFLLGVRDADCDCTFDLRLEWQAEGRTYSKVLTNGGQPFRMIGSSGLQSYLASGSDLEPARALPFADFGEP